ncbi:MAG TPA: serine/threonine-protein kinase [Thermoanaerobaculia bacterium]|nr:serine/threonine-protein kinase [Thermoanaerobaculia bacterium]
MHEGWPVDGVPRQPAAPPAEEMDASPAAGDVLGGYRILGRLGAGGMGQVFRARDDDLERDVALKRLHPALTRQPQALSRFRREARLLAAVHHPNIATLFGTLEDGGVRFLVMELVDGETLAQRLATGRMAVPEALGAARQIAAALEAAHRKGVIHRDLKPANVMVSPEGWVKVLDFGLAKVLSGEGEGAAAVSEETSVQGVLGTAPYMSPEQLRGFEADWRVDVWAFGCVLFELVTGRCAFAGESRMDLLRAILDLEPPWCDLPAEMPAPVVDLLRRCLAKDSSLRPPMSEIRAVLEEALAGLSAAERGMPAARPRTSGPAELSAATLGIDAPTLGTRDLLPADLLPASHETEGEKPARPVPKNRRVALWAALALLVLAAAGFAAWRWRSVRSSSPLAAVDSVVVMPSRLLGTGQAPYLPDAIAQTLAGDLGQMKGVTVKMPPSNFEVAHLGGDLSRVADAYGAKTMVLSTAGLEDGHLFLALQLVNAKSHDLLWSRQFQGAPGSHLELARWAAAELRRVLRPETPAVPVPSRSLDPQEERLVQQGLYYSNLYRNRGQMDDRDRALAAFEKVLAGNPTRADLAGEIAMLYALGLDSGVSIFEVQPEIRHWAERALALDPRCSKAWAALAFLEEVGTKEGFRRQLEYLLKAASYDPADSYAANKLSVPLTKLSCGLALVANRHASENDPLMLIAQIYQAIELLDLGRYNEAMTRLDQILALEPGMPFGLLVKGFALCQIRRHREALTLAREQLDPLVAQGKLHSGWVATMRDEAVFALASEQGDMATAEAATRRLLAAARGETPFPRWQNSTTGVARILMLWGRKEEALELLLFRSHKGIFPPYDYLLSPNLSLLRDDPRFRDDPRLREVYVRTRARFEEILAILEEARGKGELPEYLEQPLADLLKSIREAQSAPPDSKLSKG